ncbi:MAG TPA: VWA domain-containing protein, partial [Thermoanaerobaculia bacterium]|nr:VWA domain-containing protein [Thermoanaerobaculia bacterium]
MRLWVKCLVAVAFSTLLTSTPSHADVPSVGESIEVSIVNVDVVVTDKKGKHVRGLTQGDFEIVQDGKPQPITNFAEYGQEMSDVTVSVSSPNAPRAAVAPHPKRTLVVFVDHFSLKPFEREPLFARVKSMLHEVVRPGDAVMIVSWRSHVVTRLPFTDDRAAIDRTLDQLDRESSFVIPDRMVEIENEREWLQEVSEAAAAKGFPIDVTNEVPFSGVEAATRARFEMKRKVRALNGLMSAMSGIEGKKVLMLLTHRFSQVAGQEFLIGLEAAPHPRSGHELEFDMQREIESVAKTANANGVTVYMFYPGGLGNDAAMPNAARSQRISPTGSRDYVVLANELAAMNQVAEATGGVIGWGAKNIVDLLPSVEEDFDSYYSLAYKAT